mgnify:CR=1 FL=1
MTEDSKVAETSEDWTTGVDQGRSQNFVVHGTWEDK